MIPSTVTRNDITAPVKNLGWLLRHWKDVAWFEVIPHPDTPGNGFKPDAVLIAHLKSGRLDEYRTGYASATVLRNFLDRPVFRSLSIDWYIHDNGTRRAAVSKEII